MKINRAVTVLAVVAAVCAFAVSAMADNSDMRIILDPGNTDASVTNIFNTNTPISVSWQSCSNTGIPSVLSGETACLALNNLTGSVISSLTLTFTTPSDFDTQTIDCVNADSYLTSNNCPNGEIGPNTQVSITFSAGESIPNATDFFFGADATCGPDDTACALTDFQPATVTVDPVPEPGMLSELIPTAFGVLGLGWWNERRKLWASSR